MLDVNKDDNITDDDFKPIVAHLNETTIGNMALLDINQDGLVSALDALVVVNHLNQRADASSARLDPGKTSSTSSVLMLKSNKNEPSSGIASIGEREYTVVEMLATDSSIKRRLSAFAVDEFFKTY